MVVQSSLLPVRRWELHAHTCRHTTTGVTGTGLPCPARGTVSDAPQAAQYNTIQYNGARNGTGPGEGTNRAGGTNPALSPFVATAGPAHTAHSVGPRKAARLGSGFLYQLTSTQQSWEFAVFGWSRRGVHRLVSRPLPPPLRHRPFPAASARVKRFVCASSVLIVGVRRLHSPSSRLLPRANHPPARPPPRLLDLCVCVCLPGCLGPSAARGVNCARL